MRDDRLVLAFVGMHPDRRAGLVGTYGSAGAVVAAIRRGRVELPAEARAAASVDADARKAQLAEAGITTLALGDPDYPAHLGRLPGAPDVLFVKGVVPVVPGVAIVGTRRATAYGRSLARRMGGAVSEFWPVVSGLARGIDGEAHQGTLAAGGRGVAVLGCGIDRWYPAEHRPLGVRLIETGGAVISEYPPGVRPMGWRFPPRNRIISGLSAVVVVVEAAVPGGAMITARHALDHGLQVFAVPGDIDRATSVGCNELIRDGAWPVLGVEDLVEAVGFTLGESQKRRSPIDDPVLAGLGEAGSTVDDLISRLGWSPADVLSHIGALELEGKVIRDQGRVVPR
ncbi:MAG: DNA-processing protein DprA [Acidimicrobiia bacterium]|nr:DNA-processing protein DprA [Acidimicrobiia bacterium]